jgi:RNA polymerase sigma-70 factor (ECF subfamily)
MHQAAAWTTFNAAYEPAIVAFKPDTVTDEAAVFDGLERHRGALLRAARALLRDDDEAADVVQETMLAVLEAPQRFSGRSSLKTWLHAILKNKVADVFRRRSRLVPIDVEADGDDSDALDALFNADGSWREAPTPWPDPLTALSSKRFEALLQQCLAQLPPKAARVFAMRELAGLETKEVCAALGITETHCFVLMHRARLKLRSLLQAQWADTPPATA